ncbi:hypothetical protein JGU66_08345 [Myxococcaceae bacterium JPH2]|nr:hypothetical protein [Myxococcaceae bacterium JPH2]
MSAPLPAPESPSPNEPLRLNEPLRPVTLSPVIPLRGPPFGSFLICVATFLVTAAFLGGLSGAEATAFWTLPEARLWHLFLAAQPVLWLASFLAVASDFRDPERSVLPRRTPYRAGALACFALTLFAAALPIVIQLLTHTSLLPPEAAQATRMPGFLWKMPTLSAVGTAAATVHAFGILCVQARLYELVTLPGSTTSDARVREYQRLREQLRRFLGYAAAIIGIATLSTGSLRNLILGEMPGARFSAALVMAYGAFFSALLALMFLPAARSLTAVGESLAEELLQASLGERRRWSDWMTERQAIRAYLGLEDNALKVLQDSIAVLAPIVGSLSALAFSAKG